MEVFDLQAQSEQIMYWTVLQYKDWNMHIAATKRGLCYVGSANQPFEEMKTWISKHFKHFILERNDSVMEAYAAELCQYMEGKLADFSIPFDLSGTAFQKTVWDALLHIPYGETRSYSDIAHQIGKPASVRAVGTAIGANPVLISIPCHRVIGKNGALTGYRGGLEMKTRLLQLERESARVHVQEK